MTVHNLYIFDRYGTMLYYCEWNRLKQSGITREEVNRLLGALVKSYKIGRLGLEFYTLTVLLCVNKFASRRLKSSGMLHCFGLIVSDGSKDRIEFIFRVVGLLEPGNDGMMILQNEGAYYLPQ